MLQISIIIPIYQAEARLKECLDSVASQNFKDFEVLLIDDGSTDGSPAICRDFCAADSRFVYIRQENRGASAARNTGLDNARGDYIVTLDAHPGNERINLNSHPGEEFDRVIEGRLEFLIGGHTVILDEGDSVYFDSTKMHGMRALDGKPAKFLAVITGA